MSFEEIKLNGKYCFGAIKYTRINGKKQSIKLDGVEIWKCSDKYYWVENNNVIKLGK